MKPFGQIIKEARMNKGLYLRQIAGALDMDQAIVSKLERGDRLPNKAQVLQFAAYYGIDKEELLTASLSDKVTYLLQEEDLAEEI